MVAQTTPRASARGVIEWLSNNPVLRFPYAAHAAYASKSEMRGQEATRPANIKAIDIGSFLSPDMLPNKKSNKANTRKTVGFDVQAANS